MNSLNTYIDYTLLKPEATKNDIRRLCETAKRNEYYSVCINPVFVKYASELLAGCECKVCTVVGFPLGATTTDVKVFEAICAIRDGADEVDMVMNIGCAKSLDFDAVFTDIYEVAQAVKAESKKAKLKVILETNLLNDEEIIHACTAAKRAGADFVKSCTGFFGGANAKHITLMRTAVGDGIGVKASGGIRTREDALKMISAGATRIGTSADIV